MNQTTPVRNTSKVEKLQDIFERLLTINKNISCFTLTPEQYADYCAAIIDKEYKGNPYYRGIEIKKMGEA